LATDPVRVLEDALKIYSPTTKEGALAGFLAKQMKRLGYANVRLDSGGNVLGETGTGGADLLLCGHMDTVPGRLPVRSEDGFLHGRGASDAKGALCSLLIAGAMASRPKVRVTFAGVTREEGDGLGIQTLIRAGKRYDYAIFGEPAGTDRVTIGYRGRVGAHISFRTAGGHAGSPWAHRSAFDEFQTFMRRLRKLEKAWQVSGERFRSVSVTPTLVKAGSYHNVIPSTCEATLDVRVPPGRTCASVTSAMEGAARSSPDVTLRFDEATEPYEAAPSSRLLRAVQRAILLKAGRRPVMIRKTGTGDMNTLASAMDAQCVTYGPGNSKLSHTDAERISVEDYLKSIDVLAEAVNQLGLLNGP
jgi:[amino group carrier protein]-lysine/ornithine hydrolase